MAEINELISQYENAEGQNEADAVDQAEQTPPGRETQQEEPALPQGREHASPGLQDDSHGGLIAPDAREIPPPGKRPGKAENIRLPDAETDPHKDRPDADSGPAAPPPTVADMDGQERHEAPLHSPNADGQAAPDVNPDPPKPEKTP